MTDAAIIEHVAKMNRLRKRFASFWRKHFGHVKFNSKLLESEAIIREWNAFRTSQQP